MAPIDWINYDASPMIILQKIPVIGKIIQMKRNLSFPKNIKYGNIVKGFSKYYNSCDAVYCSHVLEHLTYEEFIIAIKNTFLLLKKGGIFRLIMPDLKTMCEMYMLDKVDPEQSIRFMLGSGLGIEKKRRFIDRIIKVFSNSGHNWLWDYRSVEWILKKAGFINIHSCSYHDSEIKAFESVEDIGRFKNALAIEARK